MTLADLYEKGKGVILSSRTAHLGLGVMVLGIIISGYYSVTEQHKITVSQTVKSGNMDITLNRFNDGVKSSISFTLAEPGRSREIQIPYYIDANLEPVYKEPYVLTGIGGDIYIAPQVYEFYSLTYNTGVLMKDQEAEIAGIKVRFNGFEKANMGGEGMSVFAGITINGKNYSPGIIIKNREPEYKNEKIAGTDRTVSIIDLDVKHQAVMLHITKSADDVVPPDYAVIDVSFKRMIWLVWLGTLLITAGMIIAFARLVRNE
jgi:cytochrome c biogenesis factor